MEQNALPREIVRDIEYSGRKLRVVERMAEANFSRFWDEFSIGRWEPNTLAMIDAVADEGVTFYDVGSWVGPTTLWAASKGCNVFSFEPDPVALRVLQRNLVLNPSLAGRVSVVASAAGKKDGMIELYGSDFGNSESTIHSQVQRASSVRRLNNKIMVPVVDLFKFVNNQMPHITRSFLKLDIEGAEFGLLPKLFPLVAGYGIPLCVTLHPKNIVFEDTDAVLVIRTASICSALSPFVNLYWSAFDGSSFVPLKKEHVFKSIVNNLTRDSTIIFSRQPLHTSFLGPEKSS